MNRLMMDEQIKKFRARLKNRHTELLEEIHEELLKSEHEQYADLVNHVHDIGDGSVADPLSDINLAVIDHHLGEVQDVEAVHRRWRVRSVH